jgi:hypothetical protein
MLRILVIVATLNMKYIHVAQSNEIKNLYDWNADRIRTYWLTSSSRISGYP